MEHDNTIKKLVDTLSENRDEIVRLREQIDSKDAEIKSLHSLQEETDQERKDTMETILMTIIDLDRKVKQLTHALAEKDARILSLEQQLKQQRGKRFAPTAEQARLLNGRRKKNDREEEKDQFDGTSVPGNDTSSTKADSHEACGDAEDSAAVKSEEKSAEKELTKKNQNKDSSLHSKLYAPEPDGAAKVDETIKHKLEDYYTLPAGARYLTRDGKTDIYYYTHIERIPERIVKHVYEVASVIMPDDNVVQTMDTPHITGKCPLSPSLMAWVLVEKYVYHAPINTIKKKLRAAGYNVSKSVLGRYFHQGMQALVDLLQNTMHKEVSKAKYLMIDETSELVGITDEETGQRRYRKRYLWAFYDKVKGMVSYVYEHGSRARKVVLDFLETFSGHISTDGYVAYSIFDSEKTHTDIKRSGCWTHARRMFVEALESERAECTTMINNIGRLFAVEIKAKVAKMEEKDRMDLRVHESTPILHKIKEHLKCLSDNPTIMAGDLMKKAVNYMLGQWTALQTYITSGLVEISNNLCEQRMKTIKLTLKNCQNIGSEEAAGRAAFFQSLVESCTLNKINPLDYITSLFELLYKGDVPNDKVALLPCYWRQKC